VFVWMLIMSSCAAMSREKRGRSSAAVTIIVTLFHSGPGWYPCGDKHKCFLVLVCLLVSMGS
jgi:hypothetical protein